jgi:hypothetical protein
MAANFEPCLMRAVPVPQNAALPGETIPWAVAGRAFDAGARASGLVGLGLDPAFGASADRFDPRSS